MLCAWRLFRGKRTFTFFLTDEVPTLTLFFQNEFNVNDTLYLTAQTKRKVSFDRSFAVCCGESSAYDDNTEVEYESETSSLSYSFARHLTQALQFHKLYLISPELPVGSSILITDIESELSDATNANNHVKFKWKPLRKQVPFTVPRLHLYNASSQGDFSTLLDQTLVDIANLNARNFSVTTSGKSKVNIFNTITNYVTDTQKRDEFARSLMRNVASFNFEDVFGEKYDFFSRIFEHLLKGFNNAGGGKYAEYYTPRAIAQVMVRLLVGDDAELRGVTCYDPSAGTGTLLMALAHQIGEERCTIYSQDISEKSSEMLRLNLILNNFASSLQNVVQGNTLTEPSHKEDNGTLKKFDFIVSNPPFKLDFSEYRETLATDSIRFWAGVPNAVKKVDPTKPKMAIYTCFIQHVLNSFVV